MTAIPCPPPIHIVARPYFPLRFLNSYKSFVIIIAPVAPTGWPNAIAPPLTFTFSQNLSKADTDETESFNFQLGTTF